MGLDAFLEIDTWRAYQAFFDLVSFIVMMRPEAGENKRQSHEAVESILKNRISEDYAFSVSQYCFTHEKKHPVCLADVTPLDISSTKIRQYVKERRSIRFWVPEGVATYIETKGLYR
jgi:nicotinate-nucleotide adenylyltransferase